MSIDTDYATLRSVIHEHRPVGWAAEFGVYSGYSLAIIAEHMPVIGFDSFEGLPEDWREGFPKGMFDMSKIGENAIMLPALNNAMVVKGWFDDTAPTFPFPALGLVHIDCDLYSSTVTALEAVTPYVDIDTIIVFDEYHSYPGCEDHEARAFSEWTYRYKVTCEKVAWAEAGEEAAFRIVDIAESV